MLDPDFVISTHDEIIARSGGLAGLAHAGHGGMPGTEGLKRLFSE